MSEIVKEYYPQLPFEARLNELYKQIKKMKLKKCVTYVKADHKTEVSNILKITKTKRVYSTNEISFKMDDYIDWSIHEYNIDEIIIHEDCIQLFDNDMYLVAFTK